MAPEYENEIVVGKTRCLWVPTEKKGTVVRVWADHVRNGQLWMDVDWDDGMVGTYPGFDHEIKMFNEEEEILDIDRVLEDAHETNDSSS